MEYNTPKIPRNHKKTLPDLINYYLDDAGLTQSELARRIGKSKSTVSRMASFSIYKEKPYHPKPLTLFAVCLALGLNMADSFLLFCAAYSDGDILYNAFTQCWHIDSVNAALYNKGHDPLL